MPAAGVERTDDVHAGWLLSDLFRTRVAARQNFRFWPVAPVLLAHADVCNGHRADERVERLKTALRLFPGKESSAPELPLMADNGPLRSDVVPVTC